MSGPEFLALAWRLTAYDGVMSARVRAEEEEKEDSREGPRKRYKPVDERRIVDIHDPVFAGLIEWG